MRVRISKARAWEYFILTARFLLAWTFFRYGFSKLTNGQFGLSEVEMATPIQDLSLFKVSWYLFDHEPFKSFIAISQILCSLLLIWNRTVIIGAFLFLPIVATILIIDLSFMPYQLASNFAWRLGFYILLDLIILYHYKSQMILLWKTLVKDLDAKLKFPIWTYFLLPIFAILLEVVGVVPKVLVLLISDPGSFVQGIREILNLIR